MPGRRLAGRSEDRFGELIALTETGRELEAAHGLSRLVLLPARPGEVSAHDALDRKDAGLGDDHAAAIEFVPAGLSGERDIAGVHAEKMVRHIEKAEPKPAELCEDSPFVRDATRQHPVKRADPVGGDEEQAVAKVVDIAHLAA